jgi:hypothetical protein
LSWFSDNLDNGYGRNGGGANDGPSASYPYDQPTTGKPRSTAGPVATATGPTTPPGPDPRNLPPGATIGPYGQVIYAPGTGGNIHYDPTTGQMITAGTRTPDTSSGQPGTTFGGGWDTYAANPYIAGLKALANQGITGQDAIDRLNQDPKTAGIAYYKDSGNYGIPGSDNLYIAPNANNGGALDVIHRPNPEGGSGASGLSGDLLKPFTEQFNYDKYTPLTGLTESNDPGYQARLAAAQQAAERSAAAHGTLFTGGFQKDLGQQQQDIASNEFGAAEARNANTYNTNRNNAYQEYRGRADLFYQNQNNPFQKLFAMSQLDQQAGLGYASINSNNLNAQNALNLQYANLFNNAGMAGANAYNGYNLGGANAGAAGAVGQGSAYSNLFSGLGNNALTAAYLGKYGPQNGNGSAYGPSGGGMFPNYGAY